MKYIVTLLYAFVFISPAASAADMQAPFGGELQNLI
jgi:hypothetical protein